MNDKTNQPNKISVPPSWLLNTTNKIAAITAAIVAITALMVAIGDWKKGWCAVFSCTSPAPVAPLTPPTLSPYDSPWMGGHHNQEEICGPQRNAYQNQFPNFNINMNVSEASDKDWKGHVTYKYHCVYSATLK